MNKLAASVVLVIPLLGAACGGSDSQDPPPPWGVPITGGTMIVTHDGKRAVVADPDRDKLYVVDLGSNSVQGYQLNAGDEPGRLVEDGAGRVHVGLRRGGALLTLDGTTLSRRAACAEPRGLAWDPATDLVHLACSTGELMSFPAAGGDATRVVLLDRDLRDVIVQGDKLIVSRFRAAELLTVDATGAITTRDKPAIVHRLNFGGAGTGGVGSGSGMSGQIDAVPAVAWRTLQMNDGSLLVVHQRQIDTVLHETEGGYGQGCGGGGGSGGGGDFGDSGIGFGGGTPVEAAVSLIRPGQQPFPVAPFVHGALPVDAALDPTGTKIAFAVAGAQTVQIVAVNKMGKRDDDQCGGGGGDDDEEDDLLGTPTSVQYTPAGDLVVFYPEYPAIVVHGANGAHTITLPAPIGYDAGRTLFHTQTSVGIACASCHPEGRDDGLVWTFAMEGKRRTQSLAGGIMDRAPYHWNGDMHDLQTLMDNVFAQRMLGGQVSRMQHVSLGPWLNRLPAPAPSPITDTAAVARGQALFESNDVGCLACHNGALYSSRALVVVGTGAQFKVPSLLGVSARAPFMHDGCAATLADRFSPLCGGGDLHGHTSQLTTAQISDLVAYLKSL